MQFAIVRELIDQSDHSGSRIVKNVINHKNLLKYWFTLLHFVMDDPVDSAYCIPYRMENPAAAA